LDNDCIRCIFLNAGKSRNRFVRAFDHDDLNFETLGLCANPYLFQK